MKWKLVANKGVQDGVPACLVQRSSNPEEYRTSYHSIAHVTDTLKEELLARLNTKLIPSDRVFELPGWKERHAKDIGYIKALKEVIELLP